MEMPDDLSNNLMLYGFAAAGIAFMLVMKVWSEASPDSRTHKFFAPFFGTAIIVGIIIGIVGAVLAPFPTKSENAERDVAAANQAAAVAGFEESVNNQGFTLVEKHGYGPDYSYIVVETKSGCQVTVVEPMWDGKAVTMRVANKQTGATFILNNENAERLCTG